MQGVFVCLVHNLFTKPLTRCGAIIMYKCIKISDMQLTGKREKIMEKNVNNLRARILSLVLTMSLVVTMMPMNVFAADTSENATVVASGDEGIYTWTLYENGEMHVDGTQMGNYSPSATTSNPPWEDYNEKIETLYVTSSMYNIGTYAFYGCTNLETIYASNVTEIGDYAFANCTSLQKVDISNVKTIGNYSFASCSSLTKVFLNGQNENVTVGENAFNGDIALVELSIPGSATIETKAFANCSKLKTIFISTGNAITSFNAQSDSFNSVVATVIYPYGATVYASVKSGSYGGTLTWTDAYYGRCGADVSWEFDTNTGVLTLKGTGSTAKYSYYAMTPWTNYSNDIETIIIEDGITKLREYNFEYLSSVTNVVLPNTLEMLYCNAFNSCSSLNNIIIPASLTEFVEGTTFSRCTALTDVYYMGTAEEWNAINNVESCMSTNANGEAYNMHFLEYHEKEETCTSDGYEPYYSFNNDSIYAHVYDMNKNMIDEPVVIPATGHAYGEWVVTKEATCTETGSQYKECDCGDKVTEEIEALGHDYSDEWTVDEEATCTEPGSKSHHCTRCSAKTDVTEILVTGHTYSNGICSVCGNEEVIPVLEVSSNELIFYKGAKEYINANCSVTGTKITYTSLDTSIATVDANGYVIGKKSGITKIIVSADNCSSVEVKIIIVDPKLSTPSVSISTSANGLKVSWGKISGASNYEVWKATGSGSWSKVITTSKTSYVDKSIAYGKTYKYKVKAVGTSNGLERKSSFSSYKSKKISTIYKPGTVIAKSSGYKSIKITWSRSYPAKGYEIYRATSKNGTYKKIKTITSGSTLSYTNTGLTTGKTYYYKIRAVSGSKKSSFTSKVSAAPKLATPTMQTSASATKNTITIKWNKVSGASGYVIYRKSSSSSSWTKVGTVTSGSTTTYKNKSVSGSYYYSVKAYRTVNGKKVYSSRSETVRLRTLKPTSISVSQYGDEFIDKISWNKVTGATGYQVYMKKGENGSWSRVTTTTSTSCKQDVTHGVYYYWKVRPIYKNNGITTYGPYSDVENLIISYSPSFSVFMSNNHNSSTGAIAMLVTNNGDYTLRIYSNNAYYDDATSSAYDRDLYLVDTINETFEPISYVDIPAGETVSIGFFTEGGKTWYEPKSRVRYDFRYDGIKYRGSSSAYYGSTYVQK